ncbi:uncharacterized protein LOC100907642 [Galendromus occidentalis]|uniref:Uncharacterized protein LOC100907642 n=1 Tax=Galendromus occidentalis TaxID=34638 RepID=A0AAJ6QNN0_9ACAR|nr:uncharacterized protein LOC100907642 [Galendromus occidentalis]
MSTLERVATANLGVMIALNMTKPATPAKHLLREAKKVYSCATSRFERWLVAMDKDYLLRIVMWHFSRSFEELKTAILNDLDNGYESLQFVMQIAPKFMSSTLNSALQQVACDYLWSKTIIEKIFRIWPLAAGSNNDKRLFRDVLIQLYRYITRSLITWLTQYSPTMPDESPFLQELSKVIELLLKSVQCIAHHGSLSKTNKRLSFRGLFSNRSLMPDRPELSPGSLEIKKKFSAKTQKNLECAFVDQMKCLRRDIGQRRNSIKCARWLTLAVPREVQNEPLLLRSDSIASIAPLTSPFEDSMRRA